MRRLVLLAAVLLAWLPASGCGQSDEEALNYYLRSVLGQERRLQNAAGDLWTAVPFLSQPTPDFAKAREQVRAVQNTVREAGKVVAALHPPKPAEDLHKLYVEEFDVSAQRVDKLMELVDAQQALAESRPAATPGTPSEAQGQLSALEPLRARVASRQQELADLAKRSQDLENRIHAARRTLIDRYNLSVPGEAPPTPQQSPQ